MTFQLSQFGEKVTSLSGIARLMQDLGEALNENPDFIFLGGGNPSRIPEIEKYFVDRLKHSRFADSDIQSILGNYQSPQGKYEFRKELADYLRRKLGWNVSARNIAVSNGSQSAFFIICNLLAGKTTTGVKRCIHFPIVPEYVGYADAAIDKGLFTSRRPTLDVISNTRFKYKVDFTGEIVPENTAAMVISRPTNPTGNVISNCELANLHAAARDSNIPLIIDGAYGGPFPNITFTQATPFFSDSTILMLSLSKLGLPAVRTGIIVGEESFIQKFSRANTVLNLASASLGPYLSAGLFNDNRIDKITSLVTTHYREKMEFAVGLIDQELKGSNYKLHVPEGAFFLWLWLEDLPVSSHDLYLTLKENGVLVIPGEDFFIGQEDWKHSKECLRISYAQDKETIRKGIKMIASIVHSL